MDPELQRAICAGELRDDMTFAQRVWAITARIPCGKVATYGQVARILGGRWASAARAVGMALNRNPFAPTVPCHRVVGADGALVGFASGLAKKRRLLTEEGVQITSGKVVMRQCLCEDAVLGKEAPSSNL